MPQVDFRVQTQYENVYFHIRKPSRKIMIPASFTMRSQKVNASSFEEILPDQLSNLRFRQEKYCDVFARNPRPPIDFF